jgi:hypothetical protein
MPRLSQIASSPSNFATGDQLVGVRGGTTDQLFSFAQIGAGGGGGAGIGDLAHFSTPAAAQLTAIPDTVNFISVAGFNTPGDGGAGTYARVTGPFPSVYTGFGPIPQIAPPAVPPGFTSVGVPTLVYSTTFGQFNEDGLYGVTTKPIFAGCLAFVVIFDNGTSSPATSFTDSAGNTYTLAASLQVPSGSFQTIYYCSNPVAAPVGTKFNVPAASGLPRVVHAYTVPGFTGAVLDQTATQLQTAAAAGGVSITSPALTANPELIVGTVYVGNNTVNAPGSPTNVFAYTPPADWLNLTPPISAGNVVACTVANSQSAVTFHPTWDAGFAPTNTVSALATFKTFPQPSLNTSYWQLRPSWPMHTAVCGVDPSLFDNVHMYEMFGNYLVSVAPPASQIGNERIFGGRTPGSVTISIANPAIITVTSPNFNTANLRNGQRVSFQTTGTLPAPIVPGQIYYVYWGSVASVPNPSPGQPPVTITFKITIQQLFMNLHGSNTGSFGVTNISSLVGPVSTVGGTQSGSHSITIYDENWVDFVLDPGLYWASGNAAPGIGWGLKKLRMLAYGAKAMTDMVFAVPYGQDQNAATGGSNLVYQAQFQTTNSRSTGRNQNFVVLTTPANASNFHVNSWVALMAVEMQQSDSGNWNPYYFEFQKIQMVDPTGSLTGTAGTIVFYDKLQYNYKSTYPVFRALSGGNGPIGPGTIVQFSDCFDQELEVHGLSIYGLNQQTAGCMVSQRYVDCDVWGFGFKCGPSPVLCRKFTMENCRFYNFVPEVDKMIDTCEYINCTFDENSYLFVQSGSINKFVIDRCRFLGGLVGFGGTAKDLTIRDTQIASQLIISPVYGGTERMLLENCDIQTIQMADGQSEALSVQSTTFVNGTIKIAAGTSTLFGPWRGASPPDICPAPWAAPGAKVLITCDGIINTGGQLGRSALSTSPMALFTVLDVYMDGANAFCIDTNMRTFPTTTIILTAGVSGTTMTVTAISPSDACLLKGMTIQGAGIPADTRISGDLGNPNASNNLGAYTLDHSATVAPGSTLTAIFNTGNLLFLPHPCARLTVLNCTGGRFVGDMAGAPPDLPMFSYAKRKFFGLMVTGGADSKLNLIGNVVSITIDVRRAYNGADAVAWTLVLYTQGWKTAGGNTYPVWTANVVNVKTAGVRTITATAVTGGVAGDTLVALPYFLTGQHWVTMTNPGAVLNPSDNLGNLPEVIITAQTDQGINFATLSLATQNTAQDEIVGTVTGATTL